MRQGRFKHIHGLMRSIARRPGALAALLVIGISMAVFAVLAEEAGEDLLMTWDVPGARWVHGLDGVVLDRLFHVFTIFGGGAGLLVLSSVVLVALAWKRRYQAAAFVVFSVLGAQAISPALKGAFGRPRPGLADAGDRVFLQSHLRELLIAVAVIVLLAALTRWRRALVLFGALVGAVLGLSELLGQASSPTGGLDSFPSGHGMSSAALVAALVALAWPTSRRYVVLIGGALFLAGVGLSRLYFGVHYPSDILAAWCVSFAWVAALWLALPPVSRAIAERLEQRPRSLPKVKRLLSGVQRD